MRLARQRVQKVSRGAESLKLSARSCQIASARDRSQNFSVPFTRNATCLIVDHQTDLALPDPTRIAAVRLWVIHGMRRLVRIRQSMHQIEDANHLAEVFPVDFPVHRRAIRHKRLAGSRAHAPWPRGVFQVPAKAFRLGGARNCAAAGLKCPLSSDVQTAMTEWRVDRTKWLCHTT